MFNGYNYPWTDLHNINLDWLLKTVQDLHITAEDVQEVKDIAATFSGYVWPTVKTYGAVGDGTTDDSAAILQCAQENDVVIFPDGQYYLGSTLSMANLSNKLFIGWPIAEILTNDNYPQFSTGSNIAVKNLIFTGSKTGAGFNLSLWRCNNVVVQNCKFIDAATINLQLSDIGNASVIDCEISGSNTSCGLSFSLNSAVQDTIYGTQGRRSVRGCYIHDCGLDGIIANNHNITISDCVIDHNGLTTKAGGIYCNSKSNILINNCRCSGNTGNGIDVVALYRAVFDGCICDANGCAGIFLGGCNNTVITNCYASSNGNDPLSTQDSGIIIGPYEGSTSNNCRVNNCYATGNAHYGYRFMSSANTYLNNNYASGNTDGAEMIDTSNIYRAQYVAD